MLHPLLVFVFSGLASTLATSTQTHYTLQTLASSSASQTSTQDYPRDASGSFHF